jgi:hypothetical protein
MAHLFWENSDGSHRYHLANWGLITQKKELGGIGVQNLRDYNLCILAS